MPIDIPNDLLNSLPDLRRQHIAAKREMEEATQKLKKLGDLIEAIERAFDSASVKTAPGILVLENQLQGLSAPKAMARILLTHPEPVRANELADALYRGGQAPSRTKIRQNVKFYMKRWRTEGWLEPAGPQYSYRLTASGREKFSTTELEPPSELSLPFRKESA